MTQPGWLSNISDSQNHSVTNIPYCWGGWNAETFKTSITNGKYAGNVNTSSNSLVSGTVGMDCSGFVSVVFNLPSKHGTSELKNCFDEVNSSYIQMYDILNKAGSHVRIVGGYYTQNGVQYVNYYDENITDQKIAYKTGQKLSTLLNQGYVLMRYSYLP